MQRVEEKAAHAFAERFGVSPNLVASAPGRVNLIGEHTDYNSGFVLPCAVDRRIAVAVSTAPDEGTLYSIDFDESRPLLIDPEGSWADYPCGVAWALREAGAEVPAFRAAFVGDVPQSSGLSSSAAIEAATALALATLFGLERSKKDLALVCQRAENDFVGVPCGIMDQYASLLCEAGSALLVDCRSLEAQDVPLDLEEAGLTLLICDTHIERDLSSTGYEDRRRTCEEAARKLGVDTLRDASEEDLKSLSGEELKRARHVVRENARVQEAVRALQNGDFSSFGRLMYDSHFSLRDDYEVSTPELDAFVETTREVGTLGARLTGAGFGGCAIALVATEGADALAASVRYRFEEEGFEEPTFYEFRPATGAQVTG